MNAVAIDSTEVAATDRNQGLGASDAAAAVGLSKWCTPVELYLEKIGATQPDFDAEALHLAMGKALEPVVLERFCRKSGLTVSAQQLRVPDPAWPTRWVTLDAIASDGGMVEAKTTAIFDRRQWGEEFEDDAVPMQYYLQAQHGMACTGLPHTWMPLLILNRQFRLYRIRRDDELIERLTEKEKLFWACVENRTPPDILTLEDASLLWPRDSGQEIEATPEIIEAAAELKVRKAALKEFEAEIDALALRIKTHMGEHAVLVNTNGTPLCTWKTAKKSTVFDKDTFRAENAALYHQYEIEKPGSRRFLVK